MEKGVMFILMLFMAFFTAIPLAIAGTEYNYYVAGAYVNAESKAFIDVLNPGDKVANIDASVYYEKNDSGSFILKVDPFSTTRLDLSQKAAGNFGIAMTSDRSVVVGSVEYDAAYSGGFGSLAAPRPDFVWYFSEGYSSGMVKTYLYILNPNPRESNVGVTLYYENGEKRTFNLNVPAYRHATIDLKEKTMPEKRFGLKVTGTAPIVAATANYNKKFSASSGAIGTNILSKSWTFPDGYTSVEATEFINVVNPSFGTAHITFTIYYDDGTKTSFDDTVPANSKKMFLLNNYVSENRRFSTSLDSDISIAAENTHYDESYSAGHGGAGATATATESYFPYSFVNDDVLNQLAIFNPSQKESTLDMTFYYADGTARQLKESVPAMMRSTIDLTKRALPGKPFGLLIQSSEPIFTRQIIYDEKQSAGYAYFSSPKIAEEEEPQQSAEDEGAEAEAEELQYILTSEDAVSRSKLGDTLSGGMTEAKKYAYAYGASTLLAWHFSYDSERAASQALRSVLSGDLFSLLEVTPASIRGISAHHFTSQKSEGYIWLNGKDLYIFVGPSGNSSITIGLAELFVAGTPPQQAQNTELITILVVLVALILVVFIVRKIFGKRSSEEKSVWEGIIPSAKPKSRQQKKQQHKDQHKEQRKDHKKAAKQHQPSAHDNKEAKKDSHKEKTAPEQDRPKQENKETKKDAKEQKAVQQKSHHDADTKKNIPEKVKDISIREIPRDKLTAQDLLDEMEEIPDYEDVFRHVNRDQEEIKPK